MQAYIYQAALLCEDCAVNVLRNKLRPETAIEDTDADPQGPYPDGGGEADSPQHCDHCGLFLENPLTADGEKYVRDKATDGLWNVPQSWRERYSYLFDHA